MSTILTAAIINSAKEKVENYVTTANGLHQELEGVISKLVATEFNGDAANGYKEFYDKKVVPVLTDSLTAEGSSLTANIKLILDSIKTQLLDTVDPQLGEGNKNPGAAAE